MRVPVSVLGSSYVLVAVPDVDGAWEKVTLSPRAELNPGSNGRGDDEERSNSKSRGGWQFRE